MSENNLQIGGDHYTSKQVQPWDAMEAWMSHEAFCGYLRGNQESIRQMQDGEQDDGPWMQGADIVRRWFLEQMLPGQEGLEE